MVVTGMDTPKYGETLKFVYIKYQSILVKSYQRFTKFNYGATRIIYESKPFRLDLITRDQCLTQQLLSA